MPPEGVDRLCGIIEPVFRQGRLYGADGFVQPVEYPFVEVIELSRLKRLLSKFAFEIHENEARGVPHLVAKGAVSLYPFFRQNDIPSR